MTRSGRAPLPEAPSVDAWSVKRYLEIPSVLPPSWLRSEQVCRVPQARLGQDPLTTHTDFPSTSWRICDSNRPESVLLTWVPGALFQRQCQKAARFHVGSDGRCHLRSQSISSPNVRNFGRSLLAGYCPTYMPDLVLHGTSSDEKLKQCLAADLAHTVQASDASRRLGLLPGPGGGQGCAWPRVRSRDCRWSCRQGCRDPRGW